jgi:Cft2 family RNA processing exonuclease
MTHMSKSLTKVLLYDSLKIMEREAEIPIYAENHVREMLDRTVKLGDREIDIKCKVCKFGLSAHADKMEILLNIANR